MLAAKGGPKPLMNSFFNECISKRLLKIVDLLTIAYPYVLVPIFSRWSKPTKTCSSTPADCSSSGSAVLNKG